MNDEGILQVTYWKLGNNRYMRDLTFKEDDKIYFVNDKLNLVFLEGIKSRDDLMKDYEMVKLIIDKQKQIKINATPSYNNEVKE